MSTTPVSSPSALDSFWNSLASDATSGSASLKVSSLCVCAELSSLAIRKEGAAATTWLWRTGRRGRGARGLGAKVRPIALLRSMGAALGAIVHDVIVAVAIVGRGKTRGADRIASTSATATRGYPLLVWRNVASRRFKTQEKWRSDGFHLEFTPRQRLSFFSAVLVISYV